MVSNKNQYKGHNFLTTHSARSGSAYAPLNFRLRKVPTNTGSTYSYTKRKLTPKRWKQIFMNLGFVVFLGVSTAAAVQTHITTRSQSVKVELDWSSKENVQSIDLQNYLGKFVPPPECDGKDTICTEDVKIDLVINKVYTILSLHPIDSPYLTAEDFSNYYPNIEESEVTKYSPPQDILIAQRALYERGLLPVLPTGKYGALTEKAILNLQQIKGIDRCTDQQFFADSATVRELNILKGKMKDSEYLKNTLPPPLNYDLLCEPAKRRVALLDAALNSGKRPSAPGLSDSERYVQPVLPGGATPPKGKEAVQFDGFIEVTK